MPTRRPRTAFYSLTTCLSLVSLLGACSESSASPGGGEPGGADSGGSAGSASVSGSGGSGSGGSGGAPVGTFLVSISEDPEQPSGGLTTVSGKVNDGPIPETRVWDLVQTEGDCRLEKPRSPFCEPTCGEGVCVEDDTCASYPTAHSVGEVTLEGVALASGETTVVLREILKQYQQAAGTMFAFPPFAEGAAVSLHATGGDYAAFDLLAPGILPLQLTSTDFELDEGKPLELSWAPASDPKSSQLHVELDLSHHGGSRGRIECDTDDDGSLVISGEMMSELIGLGVAGFPKLVATRKSRDATGIAPGLVELGLVSQRDQVLTVAGIISCTGLEPEPNAPPECPDGAVCQQDLTCP